MTTPRPLGRLVPKDFDHVAKYRLAKLRRGTPARVEEVLPLPYYHWSHDQGTEGACVGFAASMMMAIRNELQARDARMKPYVHWYNCMWLYREAQRVDEWPGENYEGTSVRAAMDVLRTLGHVRIGRRKIEAPAAIAEGISENRWATTVDEIRACIADGMPVTLGINWYSSFDEPRKVGRDMFIGREAGLDHADLGYIRGGHSVCIYGASDVRGAVKLKNSWGRDYPLVWLPYGALERVLREDGEATVAVDR